MWDDFQLFVFFFSKFPSLSAYTCFVQKILSTINVNFKFNKVNWPFIGFDSS